MTGFGTSSIDKDGIGVCVEAKSVNGRFLKPSVKLPANLGRYESTLEGLLRDYIFRFFEW